MDHDKSIIDTWEKDGRPIPPPEVVKHRTVAYYQNKFLIEVFIETGTYFGDMIEAQRNNFKKIISIELGEDLYLKAKERFKQDNHIEIINGDSGIVLAKVLEENKKPCLFWLDGHYSSGITAKGILNTPIVQEITSIFQTGIDHVILIDDIRIFTGQNDYPSIHELYDLVLKFRGDYNLEIQNDIIRLYKKTSL